MGAERGVGGPSGWAYLGPILLTTYPVGCKVTLNTRMPQTCLNTSYRHGFLSCKFLKMGNLEDPKFLESATAAERVGSPQRTSFSLCGWGNRGSGATGLAGGHRSHPGRQRPDPQVYRGGAGLADGVELSFMKLVPRRAWQSQVLDTNHSWRRAESRGTACTWSGGARHRE